MMVRAVPPGAADLISSLPLRRSPRVISHWTSSVCAKKPGCARVRL